MTSAIVTVTLNVYHKSHSDHSGCTLTECPLTQPVHSTCLALHDDTAIALLQLHYIDIVASCAQPSKIA